MRGCHLPRIEFIPDSPARVRRARLTEWCNSFKCHIARMFDQSQIQPGLAVLIRRRYPHRSGQQFGVLVESSSPPWSCSERRGAIAYIYRLLWLYFMPSHTLGIIVLVAWKRVLHPQSEVIPHSAFEVLYLQHSHLVMYLFRSHSDSPAEAFDVTCR